MVSARSSTLPLPTPTSPLFCSGLEDVLVVTTRAKISTPPSSRPILPFDLAPTSFSLLDLVSETTMQKTRTPICRECGVKRWAPRECPLMGSSLVPESWWPRKLTRVRPSNNSLLMLKELMTTLGELFFFASSVQAFLADWQLNTGNNRTISPLVVLLP